MREFAPEVGSADVENLLSETCASTEPFRNAQDRTPNSIKHDLREYVENVDQQTQAALDLIRRALGLLMESMENTKQARVQAIRARIQN